MKTKLLLLVLLTASTNLIGQKKIECTEVAQQKQNIVALDTTAPKRTDKKFITEKIIDSIFISLQSKISGTTFKEGKYKVSSATIDDKGISINYGGISLDKNFFLGIVGAATSDDKLSNFFSKDDNLTYSIGFNLNIFNKGIITTDNKNHPKEINNLHVKIKSLIDATNSADYKYIKDNFGVYIRYLEVKEPYLSDKELLIALKVERLLKELNIKIDKSKLDNPSTIDAAYLDCKFDVINLHKADSLQFKGKFKKHLSWWNIGAKYNNSLVSIIDLSIDDLKRNKVNQYASLQLSYNLYKTNSKSINNYYFSPTISYKNPLNYKESNKKTYNIQSPVTTYTPPTTNPTALAYNVKSVSGYDTIADRVNVFAVEFPFMYYNNKTHIGADFAIKTGVNDPNDNNVSARIGVFFPLSISGKEVITLEPLIKLEKLFNTSNAVFFKENFVLGFNLSFAVPKFFN